MTLTRSAVGNTASEFPRALRIALTVLFWAWNAFNFPFSISGGFSQRSLKAIQSRHGLRCMARSWQEKIIVCYTWYRQKIIISLSTNAELKLTILCYILLRKLLYIQSGIEKALGQTAYNKVKICDNKPTLRAAKKYDVITSYKMDRTTETIMCQRLCL